MKIKRLIAAIEAEQLAKEASERAKIKSKSKKSKDEVPDLVKKALAKPKTQAQIRQAHLKEKWRPPGYLLVPELIGMVGAYRFKDWTEAELEILAAPPKCLEISDNLDLGNFGELIAYAFSNDLVKELVQPPPDISDNKPYVFRGDWLYFHRVGKFNRVETKEDAIDGWLEEVRHIVEENRRYNVALKRVKRVTALIRDMLYTGEIEAVKFTDRKPKAVPQSHWLSDTSVEVFNAQDLSSDIFFERAALDKALKKRKRVDSALPGGKRGRKTGDGTYNDSAFLKEMEALMAANKVKSAHQASMVVAQRSAKLGDSLQGQSVNSIADRLARKYRKLKKK